MQKKGVPKQNVQQVDVYDRKEIDLVQIYIKSLRLQNSNLKQQITPLRNQIHDRSIEQQLQQLKTKSSAQSNKDEIKIKKLEETETSLRKQIAELNYTNFSLNSMIEVYKHNEASRMKFKQAKEQAFARQEIFDKEITNCIDNQSKMMKDQMRILRDLKNNTQRKQKEKEKSNAQNFKKYAKLLEFKQNELVDKQTKRVELQKQATENANITNSLGNSIINFLSELTFFEKKIDILEPERSEFQKVVNWVGKCKTQKRLSADWEKVGKKLVSTLLNSMRQQNKKMKMQAENENMVLSDRIQQLERANLIYQQDIKQLNGKISITGKEQERLAACNKDINSKLIHKTQQLQASNKQINKLKTDKANLEKQLQSQTAQTTQLKKDHQQLSATFEKHKIAKQQRLSKNRKTIEELENTKQKLDANLEVWKQQNVKKQAQINQLMKQKSTLQPIVKDLQSQVAKLTSEKETLQPEKGQLQAEIKILKDKISSLQTSLDRTNNNNLELNKAKIQLSNQGQQLKMKVQETLRNSADLKLQLKQKNEAYVSLEGEMRDKQFRFSQFAYSLSLEILHQNNNIQLDPIRLQKFAKELTTVYKQARFFNDSEIIAPERVNFIIDALQDLNKCRCKNSKLVYRLDPQNTTNFHSYIDKKENLLVVVELSNGSIVGGFTNTYLESGVSSANGRGFCFNLNRERVFRPRVGTTQNVTTYDGSYFILGNAQIRLRTGDKKIFSNFGIARSYFDNIDFPRTDFLGVAKSQNNELDIDSYEFFTIQFEQQ